MPGSSPRLPSPRDWTFVPCLNAYAMNAISRMMPGTPIQCGSITPPYSSLPIATAVSAMRLEKPHSLSYHDITRTSVPSITLV